MKRFFLLSFCILVTKLSLQAQTRPDFLVNYNQKWVDSVFTTLTLDEKIGQLLMPRGNFSGKGYEPEKLLQWVKEYKIGGVVFFAGQPTTQARITNQLQAASKVPLLIGQDFEWGLAMRLDSTVRFPYQLTLGAMQGNEALIEQMGAEIGKQCKRLGVHINYAPVVDININPNNPVINFRSFGENRLDVTAKALAYMKGLQSQHIMATAKHFPGHGDTGVDSHYDLPIITHDKKRLDEVELYPYKELIKNGLTGVMTAHLSIPALDTTKNLATTFSKKIVTDLLRKELKFEGLAFTDAMDMQGAVKHFPNGQALVKAILAGNDILETFLDVPTAVNAIKDAIKKKQLPIEILDARVKKILMAKSWVGLDNYKPIEINNLVPELSSIQSEVLNHEFAEKSVILLENKQNTVPFASLSKKIALVTIGSKDVTAFQQMVRNYSEAIPQLLVPDSANVAANETFANQLKQFDEVILSVHLASNSPYRNYGVTNEIKNAVNRVLTAQAATTLCIFGNPYSLNKLDNTANAKAIVLGHQDSNYMQNAAAQAIFGAIPFLGKLPVSLNDTYKAKAGFQTQSLGRLAYGMPEQVGVNGALLVSRIDSVVNVGLREKAYPGAVVEIAKDGRVIYQKAYGFQTYEAAKSAGVENNTINAFEKGNKDVMDAGKKELPVYFEGFDNKKSTEKVIAGKVKASDLYDLASVTKISTSALAIMQLMSEGKFDLDKTFADYYPAFAGTNKANLTFRNMLTHRSGLKAWIPFWMDCIDSVATVQQAIKLGKLAETETIRHQNKQTFFQKLFKKKPTYTIDYEASVADKAIWAKALSPKTITWKPNIFSTTRSDDFYVPVADTLWLLGGYNRTIFKQIETSPVKPEQGYVYSDLHYYTYPHFMPNLTGLKWEDYLNKTYTEIGANTLTYNPLQRFDKLRIAPTELDSLFRKTLIHGRVHDEGAGMLNGVSGHAGLFGNANDLTKLMQLYLQKGYYGGKQFIKPEVMDECTRYQFSSEGNRRAIAFDKLDFNKKIANGPQLASAESYGHSGFTGTFTWIDPATNSVYVFLSNRVYPTRDNVKISTLNIRTEIGNALYKTIAESKK